MTNIERHPDRPMIHFGTSAPVEPPKDAKPTKGKKSKRKVK